MSDKTQAEQFSLEFKEQFGVDIGAILTGNRNGGLTALLEHRVHSIMEEFLGLQADGFAHNAAMLQGRAREVTELLDALEEAEALKLV